MVVSKSKNIVHSWRGSITEAESSISALTQDGSVFGHNDPRYAPRHLNAFINSKTVTYSSVVL